MSQDLCIKYAEIKKKLSEMRKEQMILKREADDIEIKIKEYLIEKKEDSIVLNNCQISLYEKKINQTFKKDSIIQVLNDKLHDNDKAIDLAESILANKKSINIDMIKIKFNKQN
jgi:hypothetical protein